MKKEMQLKMIMDLARVGEMLSACGNIASNYAITRTVSSMHGVINDASRELSNSPESNAVTEFEAFEQLCRDADESIRSFDVHQILESKLPDSIGVDNMGDILMRAFPSLEKLKNKDLTKDEAEQLKGVIQASQQHPASVAMRVFGNVSINAVFVRWADTVGLIKEEA